MSAFASLVLAELERLGSEGVGYDTADIWISLGSNGRQMALAFIEIEDFLGRPLSVSNGVVQTL